MATFLTLTYAEDGKSFCVNMDLVVIFQPSIVGAGAMLIVNEFDVSGDSTTIYVKETFEQILGSLSVTS